MLSQQTHENIHNIHNNMNCEIFLNIRGKWKVIFLPQKKTSSHSIVQDEIIIVCCVCH
jgi:hypothetical protein